jgi:hypothetical protein
MATAAQIEANRRNAKKSTGPKTEEGKARVRCNAFKHGLRARAIMPVLPQENPRELEERTQQYLSDLQPRSAIELDLIRQAARLAYRIERAERIETAHLAGRVREATQVEEPSARQLERVRDLGRRLLYIVQPEDASYPNPPGNDDPAVFVRGLEETAEGRRWLLARWAEFRNLMSHKSWWGTAAMVRFIRLQGKQPIEAFYDPELNSIFLAWDVLAPKAIDTFWHLYKKSTSLVDPAYNHLLNWDDLARRPQDAREAIAILLEVVDDHVGRLGDLLARHEAISAEEAAACADRAALDCSKEFERHRRYQSARTRELLRTLETLGRMRNSECGMRIEEEEGGDQRWRMSDNTSQMADGECPAVDEEGQKLRSERTREEKHSDMEADGCKEEVPTEPITGNCPGSAFEPDSNPFLQDSTSRPIVDLPQDETRVADRPGQSMPEKALIKANPEIAQDTESQALMSMVDVSHGNDQSQPSVLLLWCGLGP